MRSLGDRNIRNLVTKCLLQSPKNEGDEAIVHIEKVPYYWDEETCPLNPQTKRKVRSALSFKLMSISQLAEWYGAKVESLKVLEKNKVLKPILKYDSGKITSLYWMPDAVKSIMDFQRKSER